MDDTMTHMKSVMRSDSYINCRLLPLAREFYMKRFIPTRISQLRETLEHGKIFISKKIKKPCDVSLE